LEDFADPLGGGQRYKIKPLPEMNILTVEGGADPEPLTGSSTRRLTALAVE
jgi:hypothetical protein